MTPAQLRVIRPGLLTTVQDLGRWGHQAEGVPVAGPMDWFSHRLANQLAGNEADAATLEITLIGPELVVEADTIGVVTGADFEVTCGEAAVPLNEAFAIARGSRLRFGRRRTGARAYLAVGGGILTPRVLGSRATHLTSHMGGLDGRAVQAGDVLPIGQTDTALIARRAIGLTLPAARAYLRVMAGAHADWFSGDAWTTLTNVSFRVSPRSNRMGYRLVGPALARARQDELITQPLAEGAIQVPAAGEPILLMADRQTAGGYPQIASVIAADLPLAGQIAPGDAINFVSCTRAEAAAALIHRERQLLRYSDRREGA